MLIVTVIALVAVLSLSNDISYPSALIMLAPLKVVTLADLNLSCSRLNILSTIPISTSPSIKLVTELTAMLTSD